MRAQAFLVAISLGLGAVLVADGRPLPTGEPHRVGRGREEPVRAFWANNISDELATVQPQPGTAAPGDRFDLIDQGGYLGRAVVERVDEVRCGDVTYPRAQVRMVDGRMLRHPLSQLIALRPTLARPEAARVLDAGSDRATFPWGRNNGVFHLVDLDGDRIADLARQQSTACRPLPTSSSSGEVACVEVWRREAGGWRLLDRFDLPPCR